MSDASLLLATRSVAPQSEAQRIGRHVAGLLDDGLAVYLDAGPIGAEVATALAAGCGPSRVTVVTPSLRVLLTLAEIDGVSVIALAGEVGPGSDRVGGALSHAVLERLWLDACIIDAAGVDVRAGLTDHDVDAANLKRVAAQRCEVCLVVVQHEAIGRTAIAPIGSLTTVEMLVTGLHAPERELDALRNAGMACILV